VAFVDLRQIDVIAPNFKRRLSGVTSTIIQLVPLQAEQGVRIATLGPGLPDHLPKVRFSDLWRLWKRPNGRKFRVWHARRNVEMVGGLVLRDVLRMPLKLVFTSASQRKHKAFTRWLISLVDYVVATSARTATYLKVPNTVIMHGIDTTRFTPPVNREGAKKAVGLNPAQYHIGCFGRIRHQKGTDIFVEAIAPILQNNPNWVGIIAGRTTAEHLAFETQLKARIAELGLTDRILFVGEHTDIERWYQAMDLFVAPQRWEGFGLTPLEAMACGVPVVATNVGAFSELIENNVTGMVLQSLAAKDMTAAIVPFVDSPIMRKKASSAARTHIESNFQLANEANRLNRLYASLQNTQN
jgi:mannosyltransferase